MRMRWQSTVSMRLRRGAHLKPVRARRSRSDRTGTTRAGSRLSVGFIRMIAHQPFFASAGCEKVPRRISRPDAPSILADRPGRMAPGRRPPDFLRCTLHTEVRNARVRQARGARVLPEARRTGRRPRDRRRRRLLNHGDGRCDDGLDVGRRHRPNSLPGRGRRQRNGLAGWLGSSACRRALSTVHAEPIGRRRPPLSSPRSPIPTSTPPERFARTRRFVRKPWQPIQSGRRFASVISAHLLGRGRLPSTRGRFVMICPMASASSSRARAIVDDFQRGRGDRIIVAAVPQRVELGCEIVEVEGDPVRFVRQRRAFDDPRILRRALDQRQLLFVEQRQIGRRIQVDPASAALRLSELIRAWAYWT